MRPATPRDFDLLATPPRVQLANAYPFLPGEVLPPRWMESNLFLVVTQGQGVLHAGEETFQVTAGQVAQVPWGIPLQYSADARDPFTLLCIHLVYARWDAALQRKFPHHEFKNIVCGRGRYEAPSVTQPFAGAFSLNIPQGSPLIETASHIVRSYNVISASPPSEPLEAQLRGWALTFLSEFLQVSTVPNSVHPPQATAAQLRLVNETASFLSLALRRALSRAEIAERAGVSESTLAEGFRAVTGRGPVDYLIDLRISRARLLLKTSGARVAQIATQVGIPDVYHFSKLFKKRTGLSPLQYRNRADAAGGARPTTELRKE